MGKKKKDKDQKKGRETGSIREIAQNTFDTKQKKAMDHRWQQPSAAVPSETDALLELFGK